MTARRAHLHLGIGACAVSLLLILWIIPGFVSSPSNVQNVILSPLFWPTVLAAITGLVGVALLATRSLLPADDTPIDIPAEDPPAAWARLAGIASIMILVMLLMPRLGMVWTSMLCYAATVFLVRTRHPRWAIACSILLPLALYAFFAHVAGVAIPQGDVLRLP